MPDSYPENYFVWQEGDFRVMDTDEVKRIIPDPKKDWIDPGNTEPEDAE